jgi:hypothetical protein
MFGDIVTTIREAPNSTLAQILIDELVVLTMNECSFVLVNDRLH